MSTSLNWFFLRVSSNHEIETAIDLMDHGHNTFCPFILKSYRNRHRKVKEWKAFPRFLGYILYGVYGQYAPWRELKKNGRVKGVLGTSNGPTKIRDDIVTGLIRDSGKKEEQLQAVAIADMVEFADGPLCDLMLGQIGRVESMGSTRAQVSFGSVSISAKLDDIRRLRA